MRLDDNTADGEPDSEAAFLRRDERFEQCRSQVGGNPWPGIGQAGLDHVVGVEFVASVSTRRTLFDMASVALRTRLKMTCSICTRSTKAVAVSGLQRISTVGAESPVGSSASRVAYRSSSQMFSTCFSDSCRATEFLRRRMISFARSVCSTSRSNMFLNCSGRDVANRLT